MKRYFLLIIFPFFLSNFIYSSSHIFYRKNKINTINVGFAVSGKYKKNPTSVASISYNGPISITLNSGYQHNTWRGEYLSLSHLNFIKKFNSMDLYYSFSYWEDILSMKNYSPTLNYKGSNISLGLRVEFYQRLESSFSLSYYHYENRNNTKWNKYVLTYTNYLTFNKINLSSSLYLDKYNIGIGFRLYYDIVLKK